MELCKISPSTDSNSENSDKLALVNDELFIRFFKYLNDEYGFEIFSNFYRATKQFYLELIFELSTYYDSIDNQNVDSQMSHLTKISGLIIDYRSQFVDYLNYDYMNEFNQYFKTKQSNIDYLNHNKNGNCIFSKIQFLIRQLSAFLISLKALVS